MSESLKNCFFPVFVFYTRLLATSRASCRLLKKAARPTLTSRTRALIFSAAFLEIIEAVFQFRKIMLVHGNASQ